MNDSFPQPAIRSFGGDADWWISITLDGDVSRRRPHLLGPLTGMADTFPADEVNSL